MFAQRLGEEIERFEAYVLEWSARRRPFLLKIIRDIKRIVKRLFPSATVLNALRRVFPFLLPSAFSDTFIFVYYFFVCGPHFASWTQQVASYGSFVTGLSLPSSDLDLVAVGYSAFAALLLCESIHFPVFPASPDSCFIPPLCWTAFL